MSVCPDCQAGLKPSATKCKCGWTQPKALPVQQRPALLQFAPELPPTDAERAAAAKVMQEIRTLTDNWSLKDAEKRAAKPVTVAEKIIACKHEAKSEPFRASRYGAAGYARRCLDCGKVDLVMLPQAAIAAVEESDRERAAMRE